MAKLQRQVQKIFAGSSNVDEKAVFGSMKTGNPEYSNNITSLQSADYEQGWQNAIVANKAPFLEEMNGVQYGLSYQIAYGHQTGMPEWDAETEYFANTSFCQVNGTFYQSKTDNNIGNNPVDDTDNWTAIEFNNNGTSPTYPLLHIGQSLYVDESKGLDRYLNGQVVEITTQYTAALNALKAWRNVEPQYFGTEEQWQAAKTLSPNGLVNMFVIADDDSTVRLPNYPDFITTLNDWQGDAAVMGNGYALALTDGATLDGVTFRYNNNVARLAPYTSIYGTNVGSTPSSFSASFEYNLATGVPTKTQLGSNPKYSGLVADIQQERITLKYFIRLATGAETITNITNELTTNNPYSLFDYKYSDHELFNASWIKGTTVFYQKSVYVTAYEALQVEYNTEVTAGTEVTLPSGYKYVKQGLSVKLSTEAFTDYDFVIDTDAESFRCALKTGTEPYQLPSSVPVVGNGYSLALTQGKTLFAMSENNGHMAYFDQQMYAHEVGYNPSTSVVYPTTWETALGVASKEQLGVSLEYSGLVADLSGVTRAENQYLYFYVGDTVQNAALINAGRLAEQIANIKQEVNDTSRGYFVETYINGTSGYVVHSNGLIEQWGTVAGDTSAVTYIKEYSNTNYLLIVKYSTGSESMDDCSTKTATGFTKNSGSASEFTSWYTLGY